MVMMMMTVLATGALGADRKGQEKATLAGGCFWGMEELLRKLPGVVKTEVGYTGGDVRHATYQNHEGHAEAVEITFDPNRISYEDILLFFFKMHDPTQLNRQGPDHGTQYRTVIFAHSPEQARIAKAKIAELSASGRFRRPIVTTVEDAQPFWRAEDYHQRYFEKNGGSCHVSYAELEHQ